MSATFVIDQARNRQFYFTLHAASGEPILKSETYVTRASALHGIASVRMNALLNERYERKTDQRGAPFFSIKGGNNEVLGVSEPYKNETERDIAIESVKQDAPDAALVDHTKLL